MMHSVGFRVATLALVSFVGVVVLVPACRRVALRYGIVDRPASGKLHTKVTPCLGGMAILLSALAVSPLLPRWSGKGIGVLAAAALVGLVGLVDDVRNLGPGSRMAIEAAAATLAFLAGARVHVVGDVGDWVLTVIWLVVLTNSFNLLDNMDGAAAAVSSATAIALTVAAVAGGQVFVGGLAAIAAGASIGFLLYNWHPARIFMGDAGSLFLGFVLASLALMLRFPGGHISGLVAVVFLAGPALFDTTLVVISRVRAGRPIFVGGTDHTSHRLIRLGLSSPAVVGILAVVTTASAGVGVVVGRGGLPPWVVVPAGGAVGTCLLLLLAERHDAAATVKAPEIPLSQAAVSLAD